MSYAWENDECFLNYQWFLLFCSSKVKIQPYNIYKTSPRGRLFFSFLKGDKLLNSLIGVRNSIPRFLLYTCITIDHRRKPILLREARNIFGSQKLIKHHLAYQN